MNVDEFKEELGFSYEELERKPKLVRSFSDKQLLSLKRFSQAICCISSNPCEKHKRKLSERLKDVTDKSISVMWEEIEKRKIKQSASVS